MNCVYTNKRDKNKKKLARQKYVFNEFFNFHSRVKIIVLKLKKDTSRFTSWFNILFKKIFTTGTSNDIFHDFIR